MSSTLAVWLSCTPVYIQAHSYFSTSFQKSVVCCLSFYVLEVLIDSKWGDPESDSKNIQAKRYILITNTKPSCICHKKFIEKSLGIGEAGRKCGFSGATMSSQWRKKGNVRESSEYENIWPILVLRHLQVTSFLQLWLCPFLGLRHGTLHLWENGKWGAVTSEATSSLKLSFLSP